MIRTSNGISNFLPVCSVRKSTRLSSGTIQRFSRSSRPHALPAEVVDHEHAAVRLHLQRGLVELRDRVEAEVQHVERQLAADRHHRAPDAYPAAIPRAGLMMLSAGLVVLERLVVDRVVHVMIWPSMSSAYGM